MREAAAGFPFPLPRTRFGKEITLSDVHHPAGRGRHPGVVRRTLAGAQTRAEANGRTIVWIDESSFYLLPARVRTYAPRTCPRPTPCRRPELVAQRPEA